MSFEPILLAPEEELEEQYPYRRVWQTSWIEAVVLLIVVVVLVMGSRFISAIPANTREQLPKLAVALLPLVMWLLVSYRGEQRALVRRSGLLRVMIVGGLVANGILVPLDERLFLTDRWLAQQGFFGRVLGYTFTIGFMSQFLKYAVLRYSLWPRRFERRMDGVAYALAVSLGFAIVFNLRFALDGDATLSATALRVASITFSELAIGTIIGYLLVELRLSDPPVFWIPIGLFVAALLSGLYYAFRGIAIVSGIGIGATGSTPIRGLALAFGLLAVIYASLGFIINSADTRMEALTGRRQTL